ncbi:MAG: DUF1566 domain-containing protein [Treponema sp.]|nr:DUF1566 domain-containing protein [Treponema sp.]
MKRIVLIVALMALQCAGLFAQESIAVFPFEDLDKVFTRNESIMFYRNFSNEFTNKNAGKFKIVPRQEVEKLINTEAAFQLSDFSARAKTAEMERVLNGTQILSGVIGKVGNSISISVSLYTYPQLEQLPGGATLRVNSVIDLFDKIPELVQSMQEAIAGGSSRSQSGSSNKVYKVGDFGPAGGIVFYDKGVFSNGWRYLEAAPVETEFRAQWGADVDVPSTGTVIGSGKRNTELIRKSVRIAQLCTDINFDGFTDWFLPSKDELELMYKNLKQRGLGNFSDGWYWSSSQMDNWLSWSIRFSDGFTFSGGTYPDGRKNQRHSVRAIRSF